MTVRRRSLGAAVVLGLAASLVVAPARAWDGPAAAEGAPTSVLTQPLDFDILPAGSAPVGVGQLVTLRFARPVQAWAAIEQAITVTSAAPLPAGSWGWVDSRTAVYRPREFWPANATIHFRLDLSQVVLASGTSGGQPRNYVGIDDRDFVMRTGRNQIITVKNSTLRLYVQRDGRTVRTFPVSLGKPGARTRSGIKVLTPEKYVMLRMTGRDRKTGERWDVRAPYSVRLTPSGEFMHGAPWAVRRLGKSNRSQGCTNLAVPDAKWLYQNVLPGDPVITTGTGRRMTVTDGAPGSYWNYSESDWLAKSALPARLAARS